jgi:hypothetical protein
VASASLVFYAGMLLFAYIAITAMYRRSSAAPNAYPEGTPAAGLLRNNPAG